MSENTQKIDFHGPQVQIDQFFEFFNEFKGYELLVCQKIKLRARQNYKYYINIDIYI